MARRPGVARKLAIVHWMPVEMYPPAINIARHFAKRGWHVDVHTTRDTHGLEDFSGGGITVHRSHNPSVGGMTGRMRGHLAFHAGTTMRLIRDRPDAVLYFEPQSSFPVFAAGMFRDAPLFVHHHEYHEPHEFRAPGMRLARIFHRMEQSRLFQRARWISHTNRERLELFMRDNPSLPPRSARVLPNLPPGSWTEAPNRAWSATPPPPLRMVYVGSLSLGDSYVAELVAWVKTQAPGSVTVDMFSYNIDDATQRFIRGAEKDIPAIRFHPGGISYDRLPDFLRDYHTGLILYRANTMNYRHNASNKLFEYLACGLDVIFPSRALGVKQYARSEFVPRVIEADFGALDSLSVSTLSHRGAQPRPLSEGTAESAIAELEAEISAAADELRKEAGDS